MAPIGGEAWLHTTVNPPPHPSLLAYTSVTTSVTRERGAHYAIVVAARPDDKLAATARAASLHAAPGARHGSKSVYGRRRRRF
jgi:hypothetical protein